MHLTRSTPKSRRWSTGRLLTRAPPSRRMRRSYSPTFTSRTDDEPRPGRDTRMADNFVADEDIRDIARAYALDAVDDALRNMGITLDWSESSVAAVEYVLDRL